MTPATPHLDKLTAALNNSKLPRSDIPRINDALTAYRVWIQEMADAAGTSDEILKKLVDSLNKYRLFLDVNVIFDSPEDFLYRQKGQLKLDNSVIEEFLPWVLGPSVIPEFANLGLVYGSLPTFAGARFDGRVDGSDIAAAGITIKTKNQDFAIARPIFLKASTDSTFQTEMLLKIFLGYVSIECKTNLDKTMFQEAAATAKEVTLSVPSAKYFLLAEWLDMTPISSATTEIAKVLLPRKAKRLSSNIRATFSTASGRAANRDAYVNYLTEHPFHYDVFKKLVDAIRGTLGSGEISEDSALSDGFF